MSQEAWVKHDFDMQIASSSSKLHIKSNRIVKSNQSIASHINSNHHGDYKTEMWCVQYKPQSTADLIVHKNKVKDLKDWLEKSFSSHFKKTPMLLLTGPSGCGKYQTLDLLSKELNIEIHQWEEPTQLISKDEWEFHDEPPIERMYDTNPFSHLANFIFRTSSYTLLNIKKTIANQLKKRKLILLKDLPLGIKTNLSMWHSLLREYSQRGKAPLVFSISEDSSNFSDSKKLFPPNVQEELSIDTISFNPLANTFITKALQRILKQQKRCFVSQNEVEGIVESCGGDLRSAINMLQMISAQKTRGKLVPRSSNLKRKLSEDNITMTANGRDGSLHFLHALGKILYSKRTNPECIETKLPSHLAMKHRNPLQEDVSHLADKISESCPKVLLFLHQNYPAVFSNLEDVVSASDYLSTADMFSECWESKNVLDDYSLLTAIYGIMFSNTAVCRGSWRPLNKPEFGNVQKKSKAFMTEGHMLWPRMTWRIDEFFTERVPYMNHMLACLTLSDDQNRFLREVGSFYNKNRTLRLPKLGESSNCSYGLHTVPSETESNIVAVPTHETDEDVIIEEYDD